MHKRFMCQHLHTHWKTHIHEDMQDIAIATKDKGAVVAWQPGFSGMHTLEGSQSTKNLSVITYIVLDSNSLLLYQKTQAGRGGTESLTLPCKRQRHVRCWYRHILWPSPSCTLYHKFEEIYLTKNWLSEHLLVEMTLWSFPCLNWLVKSLWPCHFLRTILCSCYLKGWQ